MHLEDLVRVCGEILSRNSVSLLNPRAYHGMDARTIRYYDFEGLLSKPVKKGKYNVYNVEHVKQVVIIKILQSQGFSLTQIKAKFKSQSTQELSGETGLDEQALESVVKSSTESKTLKEGTEMSKTQTKKNPWKSGSEIVDSRLTVVETGQPGGESDEVLKSVKLGNSFLFFNTTDESLGKKMANLLYGQKAKKNVKKAILYVEDGESIELPSYTISANKQTANIGALVPDKDIYQESTGVASIFVFLPNFKDKTVSASITLDSVELATEDISLDANGCGLLRVSTHVSGNYKVTIEGISCDFQSARYELVPLTVTGKVHLGKDGKLVVSMQGEKYGVAYDGKATATLVVGGGNTTSVEVTFLEGLASVQFDAPAGEEMLSVRVADIEDAKMQASIPLTGAKESERTETQMGCLGRVVTCSMLSSEGAEAARGVFVSKGAYTNAPISIESHIADKKAVLILHEDVEDLVVAVEDTSGKTELIEVGSKKSGSTASIPLGEAYNVLRIAAYVCDEPWEGHAVVLKKSQDIVEVAAAEKADPGAIYTINLKSKKAVSVLLKVCDKRLRASYEPQAKIAAAAKDWLATAYRVTGFVAKQLPKIIVRFGYLRSFDSNRMVTLQSLSPRGLTFGSSKMLSAKSHQNAFGAQIDMTYRPEDHQAQVYFSANAGGESFGAGGQSFGMSGPLYANPAAAASALSDGDNLDACAIRFLGVEQEVKTASGIVLSDSAREKNVSRQVVKTRTTMEDAVYCDLITVDGEKTITIKLPDVIGFFDIKAFCVSGTDWQEISQNLRVEKETYIEPLIPQYAHPEDGVQARAIGVGITSDHYVSVKVDGKDVPVTANLCQGQESGRHYSWFASPGKHEVTVYYKSNNAIVDRVMRIVEAPGEEVILSQELMVLKKGKKFTAKDGVIGIKIVPTMQEDLTQSIQVLTDYSHACCEQSSAKLVAAAFAIVSGNDDDKSNGYKSIVAAEARFKSMATSQGFNYYPGGGFNYWASKVAGKRIGMLEKVLPKNLPADVKKAVNSLSAMGEVALKYEGRDDSGWYKNSFSANEQERNYFDGVNTNLEQSAQNYLEGEGLAGSWNQSQAAFCAASLLRAKKYDIGIDLANEVARSMKGGHGWHGTCELLAYLFMVLELKNSGVVSGGKASKVKVNGKSVTLEKAMKMQDIEEVEATAGPVALRVNRLEKIDLFKKIVTVPIQVNLIGPKKTFKPGDLVKLSIKTGSYENGDVTCIALPNSLSRIVAGAQVKKFQIDFAGKNEVEVDLIATSHSTRPERWAAVVRNMYDSERIGSVGLMTVEVKK